MTGRGGGGRKVLLPPINFIFKLLQTHAPVKIWLYEQLSIRIEGKIRVRYRITLYGARLLALG
jgi:small nuclear ribonucleoprotein E